MDANDKLFTRTLALAGIFQAASLVKQLATSGQHEQQPFSASIQSIYVTDPQDVLAVYGNVTSVSQGLEQLVQSLTAKQQSAEVVRYVLSLLALERKLAANKDMAKTLSERISKAKQQLAFFNCTHPNALAQLADIYLNTLSTFKMRIQVLGKQELLSDTQVLDKVRALLLAGIRSAVLWRQLGGSRWFLLLQRHKLVQTAQKILTDIQEC
jgi:high frequency lysogenization protein